MRFTGLFLISFLICVLADDIWDPDKTDIDARIYQKVTLSLPCVRLSNSTGPIGCRSTDTTYAPLWPLDDVSDVTSFANDPPSEDVIIVMRQDLLRKTHIDTLMSTGKVSGFFIEKDTSLSDYSTELQSPLLEWSLHPDEAYAWNPYGDGLALDSFDVPIWLLDNEDAPHFWERANDNRDKNLEYPQYIAKVNLEMMAKSNPSTKCLKYWKCEPVGGYSVWSGRRPLDNTSSILMVLAPMDSTAFFHDVAYGAKAEVSSIAALLGTAHALSKVPTSDFIHQIIYALFTGEAWGYAGSMRFAQDISQPFECTKPWSNPNTPGCQQPSWESLAFSNISISNIRSLLEFRNLASFDSGKLYVHRERDGNSDTDDMVANLETLAQQGGFTLSPAQSNTPGLPPSSLIPFLQERSEVPAVQISDHAGAFRNPYYHDMNDAGDVVQSDAVCSAATIAAKYLYEQATGLSSGSIGANCTWVQELITCLTQDITCDLIKEYATVSATPDTVPTYYSSVFSWKYKGALSVILYEMLGYLAASQVSSIPCTRNSDCTALNMGYTMCARSVCVESQVNYHHAYGTGIEYDYSGQHWKVVNSTKPTWSESRWPSDIGVTLYQRSSDLHDGMILFLGLMVVLLSAALSLSTSFYYRKYIKVA